MPSAICWRSTSNLARCFRPDDTGYGFDNIGEVLSLAPILIERYVSVGRKVSRLAVGDDALNPKVAEFQASQEFAAPANASATISRSIRQAAFLSATGSRWMRNMSSKSNWRLRLGLTVHRRPTTWNCVCL